MNELEFENKKYINIKGKWYDKNSYLEVPLLLQTKLNALYTENLNIGKLNIKELINLADNFKKSNSENKAIDIYYIAIEKCEGMNENEIKYIFPRITSCYRKIGQSTKVIELYSKLRERKSFDILNNVAIQTSVAAAYCDLGEYSNAVTCAKRAYALCDGNAPDELKLVFKRINKYIEIN